LSRSLRSRNRIGNRPHQSALMPWIDHTVGLFPTPADCVTCAPFMNQIATLPLVSCQRMSLLPSPSKSPVATIDQMVGAFPTPKDVTWAPFISHTDKLPLVSCQRMSPSPSPSKSPVPTIDHTLGGTFATPAAPVTWAPLKNHIATLPEVSRHSQSALPS